MRVWYFVCWGCLVLCMATTLQAQDGARFWLGVTGGYNTYSMTDINDRVKVVNANAGIDLNEVKDGNAYGILAGIRINPQFEIFGAYERVTGKAEYADSFGSTKWDLPADVFYAGLQINALRASSSRLAVSGALGMIFSAGKEIIKEVGYSDYNEKFSGSDLIAQAQLIGEYSIIDRVIISPSIGYRVAKIGAFQVGEDFAYADFNKKLTADYSGMILRMTLKVIIF